ncbi:hypothetical protein ANO14919_125250 [Xylariales sp. No.14919]|nr:hypothetical protein ANO14919_125250 [Xylariales sp. No.14919]
MIASASHALAQSLSTGLPLLVTITQNLGSMGVVYQRKTMTRCHIGQINQIILSYL